MFCQCISDGCFQALQGTEFFAPQTAVDDCRSILWTPSTVFATTVNLHSTVTISATVTESVTSTLAGPIQTSTLIPSEASIITVTSTVTAVETYTTTGTTTISTVVRSSVIGTDTEISTKTTTSTLIITITQSVTNTNTITSVFNTTETVTEQLTSRFTTEVTATSQISETNTISSTDSFSTTITSTVSTQTTTISIIPLASVSGDYLKKRAETALPAYASPCSDQSAYSSACTCIGVSPSGINYIRVPSTTVTSLVTTHITVTKTQVAFVENVTTTVNLSTGVAATATQTVTATVTTTASTTTTTLVKEVTQVTGSAMLIIETATQLRTITNTFTTDYTTTVVSSTTTTTTSSISLETTNTITLETSQTTTIIQSATSTITTISPYYTGFAIQATNDIANGAYKGQFMYFFNDAGDGNNAHVAFTDNVSLAALYASDSSGNVTGVDNSTNPNVYTLPFSVYGAGDDNAQLYQTAAFDANMGRAGCYIDSNLIFQCQGLGRKYISIYDATGDVKLYSTISEIYAGNSTGPLVLKAVPLPSPGSTPTTPAAAAKSLIIRNDNNVADSPGDPWIGYFLSIVLEGTGAGTVGNNPRIRMNNNQTQAQAFLADPATGNLSPSTGGLFQLGGMSSIYTGIYAGLRNSALPVVEFTLQSNMNITWQMGVYVYVSIPVPASSGDGKFGEARAYIKWTDTFNNSWPSRWTGIFL
ncbi:hypothetical protein TWF694_003742 [Orbilia ellipsospora]|uniref:Uncharacterized protein n=1 Tax=Orbilia ellipsospora TaxID=2528407 RepID=A0AAV9WZ14_9PEZI